MKPDEIVEIIETLKKKEKKSIITYIFYILIALLITLLSAFLIEYFNTKGGNAATKQDIERLTSIVEEIKSENEKQLEIFKGEQQIRNIKIKELYDRTITYKTHLFEVGDHSKTTIAKLEDFLKETEVLIYTINSDILFKDKLEPEKRLIEKKYELMKITLRDWKKNPEQKHLFNIESIEKALDEIQRKILNYSRPYVEEIQTAHACVRVYVCVSVCAREGVMKTDSNCVYSLS